MKKRALISVSDKTGVVEFAKGLAALGFEVVSTGGTAKTLAGAGVAVTNISDVTGFPECLDGRVKTLHPMVHAGILAMRENPEHMKQLETLGVTPIDLVAINLYPFRQTILKSGVTLEEAVENIDIGGPTMLRAAAKNYPDVAVVVDPADYAMILSDLASGGLSHEARFALAAKVFVHTAAYDALIASYLEKQAGLDALGDTLTWTFEKAQGMGHGV
jgi:phosphoribosylaminoimidazolecarboxamide formyltransferase/IMP cyclohydrolase